MHKLQHEVQLMGLRFVAMLPHQMLSDSMCLRVKLVSCLDVLPSFLYSEMAGVQLWAKSRVFAHRVQGKHTRAAGLYIHKKLLLY
jgi:hypothetical protein